MTLPTKHPRLWDVTPPPTGDDRLPDYTRDPVEVEAAFRRAWGLPPAPPPPTPNEDA